MSNETVTYSLESVLKEIKDSIKEVNQKIDTLQRDVNDLKVGQAKLTEKVEGMDKRLEKVENEQYTLVKAISDLQG
ncbi:MAG: shikimate dehydrogenase, partial [Microcystis sp. LE19-338.1B]|nr:shikimate dehydrogenase [Microcystis sp. LE19-338.1B]